jgi:hypothetical protein
MWLSRSRHPVVSRAFAALLLLLVGGGTLDWGHVGGDDPDCAPVLVRHDSHAHRFSAAPSQTTPPADHCFICHTLRLLHTGLATRGIRVVADARTNGIDAAVALLTDGSRLEGRPSRAPPTLL